MTPSSLIESNVAIIVGCMPAFSHFWKQYVGGSALLKSLRSRLRGKGSISSNTSEQTDKISSPELAPWAAAKPPGRQRYHYDLPDANISESQVTSSEDGRGPLDSSANGIIHSMDIFQHWELENDSRECLA